MSGIKNTLAKSVNWQDGSKFKISFSGPGAVKSKIDQIDSDILTMACVNVSLAEINTTPIEQYIGEEWRVASGRLEIYQIQITFKDFNNFELYRLWSNAIQSNVRAYPEEQFFELDVETNDTFDLGKLSNIVKFNKCFLIAVSSPKLDNSSVSSVSEFSITMKSSYVNVNGIS